MTTMIIPLVWMIFRPGQFQDLGHGFTAHAPFMF